ncbi:MAG: hypothetical protein WAT39_06125 [Planctomycetota bacterium]
MKWTPACLLCVALVACSSGQQIRGTDRGAVLPAVRATFALREPRQVPARGLAFEPAIEVGTEHVGGDFGQGDYRADTFHLAFAPEFSWRDVCLQPLVGLAYAEVVADAPLPVPLPAPGLRADDQDLGGTLGLAASWRGWSLAWPCVRFASTGGRDIRVGRFEVGVDLRATDVLGISVAYARQTSEVETVGRFIGAVGARIETEGLHLGLSLRF